VSCAFRRRYELWKESINFSPSACDVRLLGVKDISKCKRIVSDSRSCKQRTYSNILSSAMALRKSSVWITDKLESCAMRREVESSLCSSQALRSHHLHESRRIASTVFHSYQKGLYLAGARYRNKRSKCPTYKGTHNNRSISILVEDLGLGNVGAWKRPYSATRRMQTEELSLGA
jgi:hypothetical protein